MTPQTALATITSDTDNFMVGNTMSHFNPQLFSKCELDTDVSELDLDLLMISDSVRKEWLHNELQTEHIDSDQDIT